MKNYPTEEAEARALASFLDSSGLLYSHIPLGMRRLGGDGARLRAMGAKAGVPDYLIFTIADNGKPTAIELKRRCGGTLSDIQRAWKESLIKCGWNAMVCEGAHAAVTVVCWLYSSRLSDRTPSPAFQGQTPQM